MLIHGVREDQDIIYVDNHKFVKHISENIIYEGLKGGWTINKPEGHNVIFIVTIGCGESGLPFVPLLNAEEIVGTAEV